MTRFRAVVTATYEVEVEAENSLWVPERAVVAMRTTLPTDLSISRIQAIPADTEEDTT